MRGRGTPRSWLTLCVDATGAKYVHSEHSTLLEAQAAGRRAAEAGLAYLRSTPIWSARDRVRVLGKASLRNMDRAR